MPILPKPIKTIKLLDLIESLSESDREFIASFESGKTSGSDFQKFVDENPSEVRPTIQEVFPKFVRDGLSKYVIKKFRDDTAVFCKRTFIRKSGNKTRQVHSNQLRKHFGNNDNGFALRELLLIVVDKGYIAQGFNGRDAECKKYRLDMSNFNLLCKLCGVEIEQVKSRIKLEIRDTYRDELTSGQFAYTQIDFREFHPLQSEPSEERNEVLLEYGFIGELDISNCAPTMLYNYASHLNPAYTKFKSELIDYMDDVSTWRSKVADEVKSNYIDLTGDVDTEIDFTSIVKGVINRRIFGATMFIDDRNSIWVDVCDKNRALFYSIQQNHKLTKVLDQIINCVDLSKQKFKESNRHLFETEIVVSTDNENVGARLAKEKQSSRISKNKRGRTTYLMYSHYEKQVRDFVINYLEEQGIRYFNLHDGLFITQYIDSSKLEDEIKQKLNISVRLKMKNNEKERKRVEDI